MAKEPEVTTTRSYYNLFMGANPPRFNGRDGEDKAKSWLTKIEAFDVIELLERLNVRYDTSVSRGCTILVAYTSSNKK